MSDTSTPEAPARKNKRWLLPALLLVLATLGGAGYLALTLLKPGAGRSTPPPAPIFMALDPFTVNLQPGGAQKHLHVALTVRVQDAATQALLTQYLPEVRARVLGVLANREGGALMVPVARDALAEELTQALQRPLAPQQGSVHIAGVMFTTFLLQ